MSRISGLVLMLSCWSTGIGHASAQAAFPQLTPAELDAQRGGFVLSGVDIRLGVEMRTYIEGSLVLQTNVSWSDQGLAVDRALSSALTSATRDMLAAGAFGTALKRFLDSGSVFLANQGQTALLQRADGSLQTIILNRASNVALRQEIDATLDLGNFAPFRNSIMASRLNSALAGMAHGQ